MATDAMISVLFLVRDGVDKAMRAMRHPKWDVSVRDVNYHTWHHASRILLRGQSLWNFGSTSLEISPGGKRQKLLLAWLMAQHHVQAAPAIKIAHGLWSDGP
jgi:hypothetical protein